MCFEGCVSSSGSWYWGEGMRRERESRKHLTKFNQWSIDTTVCHWPCRPTAFLHPFFTKHYLLERSFLEQHLSLQKGSWYSTEVAISGCCPNISKGALDLAPQNNFSVWTEGLNKGKLQDGGENNYLRLPNMLINSEENAVRFGWYLKIIFRFTGLIQQFKKGNA